jgi:hypothetical protein
LDSTYNSTFDFEKGTFEAARAINNNECLNIEIHRQIPSIDICPMQNTFKRICVEYAIDTTGYLSNPKITYKLCPEIDQKVLNTINQLSKRKRVVSAKYKRGKVKSKETMLITWDAPFMTISNRTNKFWKNL